MKTAQLQINHGQALLHFAGTYPTLHDTFLELFQNSIDKDVKADRVEIEINLDTDHGAIRDNGSGTTVEKFNKALCTVAQPKRKGDGSLGQFGLGMISPLGKCQRFTFTSCPKPHIDGFKEWVFVTNDIQRQQSDVTIPLRERNDLTLIENKRPGQTRVKWRTEVSLTGITKDSFIRRVNMDNLVGAIQDRYSAVMRRNKVVVSIKITENGKTEHRANVTAPDFQGRALPVEQFIGTHGTNHFRLFVSRKNEKVRSRGVLVGVIGDDFRFPFHLLSRGIEDLASKDAIDALSSGLLEGEILSEQASLDPKRNTFVKNDAFLSLCLAIDAWYEKSGRELVENLSETRHEKRLQELGVKSMQVIENLLKDPSNQPLLDLIKSFGKGTIGSGHTSLPSKKVIGEQTMPAMSVDGSPGAHLPRENTNDRPRDIPNNERIKHTPLTVLGPQGKRRTVVKSSSIGLQFSHEAMEGSPDLWRLDTDCGILTFNIRHGLWQACEKKDKALMMLQELVTMQALTLHTMPENLRVIQRKVLDELNHSLVVWILNGDRVRSPSGRKAKAPNQSQKTA